MPHLTLEYSHNLQSDIQATLAKLHKEAVATGAINVKGLKSRAVSHDDFRIADGNPDYSFAHVGLLIREGRTIEVQKEGVQRIMAVPSQTFGVRFDDGFLSLYVNIKEMREGWCLLTTQHPGSRSSGLV